jgi:hypothetical protein
MPERYPTNLHYEYIPPDYVLDDYDGEPMSEPPVRSGDPVAADYDHHIADTHYDLVIDVYDDGTSALYLNDLHLDPTKLTIYHDTTAYTVHVRSSGDGLHR